VSDETPDSGIEAIIVKQLGSQLANDGKVVLIQMQSTVDEVFTFAIDIDAAAQLAVQIQRQLGAKPAGG
jgi:hypothetical protein